ncbi:MAG: hypothetical protein J6P72_09580 [Firmicutes bacterium]|nr:hypothetical protein [Bacillota bacterium]
MPIPENYGFTTITPDEDVKKLKNSQKETFLATFQDGCQNTKEGLEALEYIHSNQRAFLNPLNPFLASGMFGGYDADAKASEVVEQCRNIYLVDADGSLTTYADKFFNNDTVKALIEEENNHEGAVKNNGRVLMAHLSMFLTESGKTLEGADKAFDGCNPADTKESKKTTIIVTPPYGPGMIIAPKEAIDAVEASQKEQEKIAKMREELPAEITEPRPEVPAVPTEKSFFRRILCKIGFPHSAAYRQAVTERNNIIANQKQYDAKVELRQKKADELKTAEDAYKSAETPEAKFHELSNLDEKIAAVRAVIRSIDLQKSKTLDMEKKALMEKINRPQTLEKLASSKLGIFTPGNIEATVNFSKMLPGMHYRPGHEYRLLSDMMYDVTQTGKFFGAIKGIKSASKQKEIKDQFKINFDKRVAESKDLFEKTFELPCNVENVQMVIDKLNLQKQIDERIQSDRNALNANADHQSSTKLPEVHSKNLGTMTYLLMTGMKTALYESLTPEQQRDAKMVINNDPIKELSAEEYEQKLEKDIQDKKQAGEVMDLTVYQPGK